MTDADRAYQFDIDSQEYPYDPAHADRARLLAEAGACDREIAEHLGVPRRVIRGWRLYYPDFGSAVRIGRDSADERVESALFERAIGYEHESEKVAIFESGAVHRADTKTHVPADVGAAKFWLERRRPEWRARPQELVVDDRRSGVGIPRLGDDESLDHVSDEELARVYHEAAAAAGPMPAGPGVPDPRVGDVPAKRTSFLR